MKSFIIRHGVLQEKKEELRASRVGNPKAYQEWLRYWQMKILAVFYLCNFSLYINIYSKEALRDYTSTLPSQHKGSFSIEVHFTIITKCK